LVKVFDGVGVVVGEVVGVVVVGVVLEDEPSPPPPPPHADKTRMLNIMKTSWYNFFINIPFKRGPNQSFIDFIT
jgi:hypothetical protein